MLSNQLFDWNADRINHAKQHGLPLALNNENLNYVKASIQTAVDGTSAKLPETFTDQLFFLTMGAIQTQSQTGSTKPWKLLNQSVDVYIDPKQDKQRITFGLLSVITLISLLMMMQNASKPRSTTADYPSAITETNSHANTADNVTITMLQTAYKKMKNGTCQLPQAAMIPSEQRLAFINFVNKGSIDVKNVENLRLALSYVSCLYPQQLMRSETANSH